jgi:sulfatase maturation enzyme AslB (radical SAM superfamily)
MNNYSILIDLNTNCNLKCIYCHVPKKDIKYNILNTINDFFDNYYEGPCSEIVLDFNVVEIFYNLNILCQVINIFYLNSLIHGYKLIIPSIMSNGTLLNRKGVRQFFINYKLLIKHITISIDGYKDSQDIGRPNSWDLIRKNWYFIKKVTNNSINISSVFHKNIENIYASSIIKLLKSYKNIKVVSTNFDTRDLYTIKDVDKYIEQIDKIISYVKENNLLIKIDPVASFEKDMNKRNDFKHRIVLRDQITKYNVNPECSYCKRKDCLLYYTKVSKERKDIQCYMYSKLEELYNKYYFNEEDNS